MKDTNTIPDEAKREFWAVVKECLHIFHNNNEDLALGQLKVLRQKVSNLSCEEAELFFHAEPFDVACRLAGDELNVKDVLERYLEIRSQIYNPVERITQ